MITHDYVYVHFNAGPLDGQDARFTANGLLTGINRPLLALAAQRDFHWYYHSLLAFPVWETTPEKPLQLHWTNQDVGAARHFTLQKVGTPKTPGDPRGWCWVEVLLNSDLGTYSGKDSCFGQKSKEDQDEAGEFKKPEHVPFSQQPSDPDLSQEILGAAKEYPPLEEGTPWPEGLPDEVEGLPDEVEGVATSVMARTNIMEFYCHMLPLLNRGTLSLLFTPENEAWIIVWRDLFCGVFSHVHLQYSVSELAVFPLETILSMADKEAAGINKVKPAEAATHGCNFYGHIEE